MAGPPPFNVEDQTDEDFFNQLVNDEDGGGGEDGESPGSNSTVVEHLDRSNSLNDNDDDDGVQAFANLSLSEIGTPPNDDFDGAEGDHSVKGGDDPVSSNVESVEEKEVAQLSEQVEVSDHVAGVESEVDQVSHADGINAVGGVEELEGNNEVNAVGGVKQVQWSAFGGSNGEEGELDFLNDFGDSSEDPFAQIGGGFPVQSDGVAGVSFSQGNYGNSFAGVQKEHNLNHGSVTEQPIQQLQSYGLASEQPTQALQSYGLATDQATQELQSYGSSTEQTTQEVQNYGLSTEVQDQSSSQYWENMYPGWRFDPNSQQWYQVDESVATTNSVESYNANSQSVAEGVSVDQRSDVHYLQQAAQSVARSVKEESTTGTLSYWNQSSQVNTEYPPHMVFDPQYPGWYYDTIAQEWKSLESYTAAVNQSANVVHNQHVSNGSVAANNYVSEQNGSYSEHLNNGSVAASNYYFEQNNTSAQAVQLNNFPPQQDQLASWGGNNLPETKTYGQSTVNSSTTHFGNGYMQNGQFNYSANQSANVRASEMSGYNEQTSQGFGNVNGVNGFHSSSNGANGFQNSAASPQYLQQNNQYNMGFENQFIPGHYDGHFQQQKLQNGRQNIASNDGRSSAGRPPHALVSFGFGGKLIIMNDQSILHGQPSYGTQDKSGGVINILNLMEVGTLKSDGMNVGSSAVEYFQALCQQPVPGPLVSGNFGNKELYKWIDDRIACFSSQDTDYRKGEALKVILSVLKIACQHYGRLRSSFGTDHGLKENDRPESALALLFASAKRTSAQFSPLAHCLQKMPSEGQIQATADEVQMLLVSGRKMEALQCAQEGHLWGPAIVIAALLGEQFYGETVKQMALHQLVAGSPLRTLCLLLAGQPAEVFSNSVTDGMPTVNAQLGEGGPGFMLDNWEENLAVITANRTKGDELVVTHLGDCLWKERGEVIAAHICYLVAEANIEAYSESARMCLVGADHLKFPRTYASPESIQRTELYEYAKVLGNSQFVLLPFQPYKLIYAHMLAEVGKLSDSLKYCQAVTKSLKASRSSEVEVWRHMLSSLEERIKIHQQGGYAANLAPGKLVGKLLNFFDNTAHRVVGGLPPPAPSSSHSNGQRGEHDNQSRGPRVSTSQSTMTMSSLMSSASNDGNNRMTLHNRSVSEPDILRTPRKVESPEKSDSSNSHDNSSVPGGPSRLGRFGSQIFQKTVGLVLKSRGDRQAKLGETNKFYYDENLKRWVEEGAGLPAEEPALGPPPTTAAFINGNSDSEKKLSSVNGAMYANGQPNGQPDFKSTISSELGPGTPPIPSSSNQFSARGRMGVRARYVDTFNKGGGAQTNLFHSPSVPNMRPAAGSGKFFIPSPTHSGHETDSSQTTPESARTDEGFSTIDKNHSFSSPQMSTPPPTIRRHPSMELIQQNRMDTTINGSSPVPPHSRRTLSWSGEDVGMSEPRPLGEALGYSPSAYMHGNSPPVPFSPNFSTVSEDLQEVEL